MRAREKTERAARPEGAERDAQRKKDAVAATELLAEEASSKAGFKPAGRD